MSEEKAFSRAVQMIESAHESLGYQLGWRFLYSPKRTLSSRTQIMLLGLNPGGDCYVPPVASVEEGNAFRVDSNWSPDGKRLQEEVCLMFQRLATALGRPLEWSRLIDECLTANFCPFRSSRWEDLPRKEEALEFSFQLWREML